jgi:hypothetical protein
LDDLQEALELVQDYDRILPMEYYAAEDASTMLPLSVI